MPAHFDLDVIRLEVDAGEECQQHGSGLVRRHGRKLFGELATTRDEALLINAIGMFIADGIENSPLIRQKGPKPADHQVLEITGRNAAAL
jgi:hypothetical protein